MSELSPNGRRRVYRILLKVAWADEILEPAELTALDRLRAELGLSPEEAREVAGEPGDTPLKIGKSAAEHAFLARGMVEVAAADGELQSAEERILRKAGKTGK